MTNLKPHPLANIFPLMSEEQFEEFKADVKENGFQTDGLLYEGMILDGRNRYRASQELGIQIEWQEHEPDEEYNADFDPLAYVLSHNLHRRHLTTGQRSVVAAKMAKLKHGQKKTDEDRSNDLSQDDAAALLNVSVPSVKRAKKVIDTGSEPLVDAVKSGDVTLNQATNLIDAEPDKTKQAAIVKGGKDAIKKATSRKPKAKPRSAMKLPSKPTNNEVAKIEKYLARHNKRSSLQRFMNIWSYADKTARVAIRVHVNENV